MNSLGRSTFASHTLRVMMGARFRWMGNATMTGRNCWALVVALLWLYVGAYFATVTAVDVADSGPPNVWAIYPSFVGLDLRSFFEPIHQIDRRLRPQVWNPPLPGAR